MGTVRTWLTSTIAAALTTSVASTAIAQAPPTMPGETVKSQTATKGVTDVAKGGFVASEQPKEDDPKQVTDVSIGLGGLFTAGNSRTVALTSVSKTRIRRDEHQFSAALAANFARSGKVGTTTETTVENLQGLLRYDYYLSERVSLFLQSSGRRDRFQGLDLRLNVDPGVAYYFLNAKVHRLQGEIGYDLQHDIRRDGSLVQKAPAGSPAGTPPPPPLDKVQTLHNLRLFLGYENKLRKEVSFLMNVEYLQNFSDFGTYRFVGDMGLKSNVADRLALATTYTVRYENKPLPNVESLDSIASITLNYTFF